jgi:hypothetical protein
MVRRQPVPLPQCQFDPAQLIISHKFVGSLLPACLRVNKYSQACFCPLIRRHLPRADGFCEANIRFRQGGRTCLPIEGIFLRP